MTHLIGLSGSLRRGSFNSALLRAAEARMPEGSTLTIASIRGIPLYDGDEEAVDGVPEVVARLKDQIAAADGLLIATPEYNNGIPGVAKNAIDWLSRPAADIGRVFGGRPVALLGASPGGFGTILSQSAWLPVLRTLGAELWSGGRLLVARAGQVFSLGPSARRRGASSGAARRAAHGCRRSDGRSGAGWPSRSPRGGRCPRRRRSAHGRPAGRSRASSSRAASAATGRAAGWLRGVAPVQHRRRRRTTAWRARH
jgi:chromate reductase